MMNTKITLLILFIIYLFFNTGSSQSFELKGDSPFGIQIINTIDSNKAALKYIFKDMDADGDLDLFLFGLDESDTISTNSPLQNLRYFIEIQENTGDKWNPVFKEREKMFENFDYPKNNGFFIPALGDINNDGKQDIVISAEADSFFTQYLRIDIQTSNYDFETHLCSEYDLSPFLSGSIFLPELIDLDMDGDLDILLSGGSPSLTNEDTTIYVYLYAKNTGTSTDPDFLGWFVNPYGLKLENTYSYICGGDLDLDGDVDILGVAQMDTLESLIYFENYAGNDGRPSFSDYVISPFGLPVTKNSEEGFFFPGFVDIDGDGDIDLFLPNKHIDTIFEDNNSFKLNTVFTLDYYENQLCQGTQEYINESICEGDTIYINGTGYHEPGNWNIEIKEDKCIRVVHLSLDVIPVSTTNISETLCYGDVYYIGDDEFTESGIYELNLKSVSGCDSIVIADLEFIKIDTTFIDETLCKGDIFEIGNQKITETGTYEMNLVSDFGCDSVILANLEFLELNVDISLDGSVLTAYYDNSYTYRWFDCDKKENVLGATKNKFEPVYSGNFAVIITNDIGCIDTSECLYVIATDTKSIYGYDEIIILPNPAKDLISIINRSGNIIESIKLFNIKGELIEEPDKNKLKNIDLSSYSKGVYLFRINTNDKKTYIKKILLIN